MKVGYLEMSLVLRSFLAVLACCCIAAQAQYGPYYVEPLAEVTEFHGSSIGFGGAPSPYYYRFRDEVAKGASAVPLLEQILHDGSPPARLYAALALYSLDSQRGVRALESLEADTREIETLFGCSRSRSTVGETAAEALEAYRKGAKDFFQRLTEEDDPKDFLWR